MRHLLLSSITFSSLLGSLFVLACGSSEESCKERLTCPSENDASTDGATGGGTSSGGAHSGGGSGGTSGAGGSSGSGGSGGNTDSGGSDSGNSTGGDSGTGTGGDSGADVQTCDTTSTPSDEACLVSDDYAVFVAPNAETDAGPQGTKANPIATINLGITLAHARGVSRVIICNATYDETVALTATDSGISLFGGFRCPSDANPWTYDATAHAVVAPSFAGPALQVDGVTSNLRIEDMDFTSKDASVPGTSSVAVIVKDTPTAWFARSRITAGKGADGSDGTRTDFVLPTADALKGGDASGTVRGLGCTMLCPNGNQTTGGDGGNGGTTPIDGAPGTPLLGGGAAGTVSECASSGLGGGKGADSPVSTSANGASTLGSLNSTAWNPTAGADAQSGGTGQGGGGGGGHTTGGGGGGACGGCGGAGGRGGGGGGASLGILSAASGVVLNGCEVIAGNGGAGGSGAEGQLGQDGGIRGNGAVGGCDGGGGGRGASGGAGGGGAGGISVGVLYKGGSAPILDSITQGSITLGAFGLGGSQGGDAGTRAGVDGVAQAVMQAP